MTHTHEHTHQPVSMERHCDVVVIGGSAAGLAAALQLVRQRRSVIVIEDNTPRNAPAAHMHGFLGFDGASPADLMAKGRDEVRRYGGEVLRGRAITTEQNPNGGFSVTVGGGHQVRAHRVIVATGLQDELPAIQGVAERWGRDGIHCPFCHGYEVRDETIVHIVTHPAGLHPAALFAHLTDRLTVVAHDVELPEEAVLELTRKGVKFETGPAKKLVVADDNLRGVELGDGRVLPASAVVVGPRFRARLEALTGLGLEATEHEIGLGTILAVDAMGATSVPGVFAAGNVTDPSMQVIQAAAHGGRVGAMVASSLAHDPAVDGPAAITDWDARYGGETLLWSGNPNGTLVREVSALEPGRALDVGAGEGGDAVWLAEHGWNVTATDVSANGLARVEGAARSRGVSVDTRTVDANAIDAYEAEAFDLVSLQYGAVPRTPDDRGLRNLIRAVAPGGTLLVVGHDPHAMAEPVDLATETRMYDPNAYLAIDDVRTAITADEAWTIEVDETRPRPPGAASSHHVHDVVFRARRTA